MVPVGRPPLAIVVLGMRTHARETLLSRSPETQEEEERWADKIRARKEPANLRKNCVYVHARACVHLPLPPVGMI